MPVLTSSGPPVATDLAARLLADLQAGRAPRETVGDRAVAFEWAAGLPNILARQVSSAVVDGLSFRAVRISNSGTPATAVPPGGAKPLAATIASDTESLTKWAGRAEFNTEQALDADGLVPALASVISRQCLLAYDAYCGTVLDADNGLTATGATWPAAILAGIAAVAGAGGAPTVLVLSATDYAAVVQSPGVGYAMNPVDGVPSMWGLAIVVMAGIPTKTAYVIDPAAVLATENTNSPAALLDPYSQSANNKVSLVVDWWAGFTVTSPGGVCQLTYTGTTERDSSGGGSGSKSKADYALGA